jgi:WD40 repeat protein
MRSVAIGQAADRDVVATGSDDKIVQMWDAATGAPVGEPLTGLNDAVMSVAIGRVRNRDVIIGAALDGPVRIWDAATTKHVRTFHFTNGWQTYDWRQAYCVALGRARFGLGLWNRDVIVVGTQAAVWIWGAGSSSREPIQAIFVDDFDGPVRSVVIGRAGNRDVVVAGLRGAVQLWDLITGAGIEPLLRADGEALQVSVAIGRAGDRDVVASSSLNGKARIWNLTDGDPSGIPLVGHDGPVRSVAIGHAGDRVVVMTGAEDGTMRTWDPSTGDPIGAPLVGHGGPVTSLAIRRCKDRDKMVAVLRDALVAYEYCNR